MPNTSKQLAFVAAILQSACDWGHSFETMQIPVEPMMAGAATTATQPAALGLFAGGSEQEPLGPAAFDALPQGGVVIADRLKHRLALFDGNGRFYEEVKLGFAPDQVRVVAGGGFVVRRATLGSWFMVSQGSGAITPAPAQADPVAVWQQPKGQPVTVNLPGRRSLAVMPPPSETLIGVTALPGGPADTDCLALETARHHSLESVARYVRCYDKTGGLAGEVTGLAVDHHAVPVTDVVVRAGQVHQMVCRRDGIEIRRWSPLGH